MPAKNLFVKPFNFQLRAFRQFDLVSALLKESFNVMHSTKKPAFGFVKLLLCAVITTLIILLALAFLVYCFVDLKFLEDIACQRIEGTRFSPHFSYCFYSEDWDDGTYLSAITSFYTTMITILIGAQAIVSWLSFIVIRNSNKQEIEAEIEKELPKFFENRASNDVVLNSVQSTLD